MDYLNPNDYWMNGMPDPYKGMNDDERLKAGCLHIVAFIAIMIAGLLLCVLLTGCQTVKYVPVMACRTDTVREKHTTHDSIHVRDSTYVSQWQRGDTVRIVIERWKTVLENHTKRDTVYRSRVDSVPKPYPVEVVMEVEKPLTLWQEVRQQVGGAAIFLLIACAVWKIFVTLRRRN